MIIKYYIYIFLILNVAFVLYFFQLEEDKSAVNRDFVKFLNNEADLEMIKFVEEKKFVTVPLAGQLGNVIWEFLATLAVGGNYGREPRITSRMRCELEKIFETVDTKELTENLNVNNSFAIHMDQNIPNNLGTTFLVLEKYASRHEEVLRYGIDKIKQQLRKDLRAVADSQLQMIKAKRNLTGDVTYVGVHFRGTDYPLLLKGYFPDFENFSEVEFYNNAMDYYRKHFPPPIVFIFVTVDKRWLKKNRKKLENDDVYFPPMKNSPHLDIVLLASCNHSILNYGTFSATSALFTEGETIVFDLGIGDGNHGFNVATGLAAALPNWHLCNNTYCDNLCIEDTKIS